MDQILVASKGADKARGEQRHACDSVSAYQERHQGNAPLFFPSVQVELSGM